MCTAFMTVVPVTSGLSVKPVAAPAKPAVTEAAAVTVTVQVLVVPLQPAPVHPVKVEPAAGAAVRVTTVRVVNDAEHVAPHGMPAGALVTAPVPVPDLLTGRGEDGGPD